MFTLFRIKAITLCSKQCYQTHRNVQVSVIGAACNVGSNLALLLKQNDKITHMKLYDDDVTVKGIGFELQQMPNGPVVTAYSGHSEIADALRFSDIIAMVGRQPRKPGFTRSEMIAVNAQPVLMLCRAMAEVNPKAFLVISTNPVNSIVPFAFACLTQLQQYNPYKLLGITNIDSIRCRALAAPIFNVSAEELYIPVIGGHSDQTIVPVFSNMSPHRVVEACQADTLTRLVRKAGTEVIISKKGTDSSTVAMAWSINEFLNELIKAVNGEEVYLHCFTSNTKLGTRFFAGPTKVGPLGVVETFYDYPMTEFESYLLNSAIPELNKEIEAGETYLDYVLGLH